MAKTATAYTPRQVTKDPGSLQRFLTQEFQNISASITSLLQTVNGQLPLGTYKVANLPAGITAGTLANVSDGAASLAWGATVTGGGSVSYLVRYNGTNWTVVGK
jgi:hypothetical protein